MEKKKIASFIPFGEENKKKCMEILKAKGYRKVGHTKKDFWAFCITSIEKQYFEIEDTNNPAIEKLTSIEDIEKYF